MQYIPGSLGLTSSLEENQIGTNLSNSLQGYKGSLGYRIPSVGVTNMDEIPSFILQLTGRGIILIDIVSEYIERLNETEEYWITDTQKTIYSRDIVLDNFAREIETRLKTEPRLYNRRNNQLKVEIKKLLVFTSNPIDDVYSLNLLNEAIERKDIISKIQDFIDQFQESETISILSQSILEGTRAFEKKRKPFVNVDSLLIGDLIERSMDNTFALDEEQRKVSLQLPQGPQRIRGLAGTGKTVILALKAALTHKDAPSFRILSVFNTQSMYNQIQELITKYYTYETRRMPDWSQLEIMHAWGGKYKGGFYYSICKKYNIIPFSYTDVRGHQDPYEFIFTDLLIKLKAINPDPYYDMVLIDEAQDFPQPFFEVVYLLTKAPKRIVWAYDEFQSLNDLRIKEPEDLFGKGQDGNPNIKNTDLEGQYLGGIDKDFILSNSYRNPRVTLMTAHGLGLGIYRKEGIVDILPDTKSWKSIGYEVVNPNKNIFQEGDKMIIKRPDIHSKNLLESIIRETGNDEKQMLSFSYYDNWKVEYKEVAQKISELITTQDIKPEQIIVISLATSGTKEIFNTIRQELDFLNIKSITPGYIEGADMFQEEGFVTLVTPFRAKGNEANVVFVTDAQNIIMNRSFKSRNAAFVSITRSRGYCYISSNGHYSLQLKNEIDNIIQDYPDFKFIFPSEEELSRRRVILSKADSEVERTQKQIEDLMAKNPELLIENLKQNPELLYKILGNTPKA